MDSVYLLGRRLFCIVIPLTLDTFFNIFLPLSNNAVALHVCDTNLNEKEKL